VLRGARIDAAKIEAIVAERAAARTARNWAESDRLRDELADLGVAIRDNKDGTTTWEPKR
jgi:cysteinyl-tRNA synthetase